MERYHFCYLGYFVCFNRGDYYEAHDVLEHLWLSERDGAGVFHKGLIQLAGAFVHMRKQFLRPGHPTDGRRLAPAYRLLGLAARNLEPFGPEFWELDVAGLCRLGSQYRGALKRGGFQANPWSPNHLPRLHLGTPVSPFRPAPGAELQCAPE